MLCKEEKRIQLNVAAEAYKNQKQDMGQKKITSSLSSDTGGHSLYSANDVVFFKGAVSAPSANELV